MLTISQLLSNILSYFLTSPVQTMAFRATLSYRKINSVLEEFLKFYVIDLDKLITIQ